MLSDIPHITLIWFGNGESVPRWPLGDVLVAEPSVLFVASLIRENLPVSTSDAWLFWDGSLGNPDPEQVIEIMKRPGNIRHAGLKLGMRGLPAAIDFVSPAWMLNRDPDPAIEATSWRLTWRCCLIQTNVLRQMGGIDSRFESLDAAMLEFGHRCVTRGVITRHLPRLILDGASASMPELSCEDEFRFINYRFGMKWLTWAFSRTIMQGNVSRKTALKAYLRIRREQRTATPAPYKQEAISRNGIASDARVSIIIPTVDRYPYLQSLLAQLRNQTVRPHEVIIIDQTETEHRRTDFGQPFPELPVTVLYRDEAGQCSSRNAGLQHSTGDYILFLDDDDDSLPATLIESHLKTLYEFRADVSSGVVQEVGIERLPDEFTLMRVSDVFPTNNTLVRREVLYKSGLFDLAYEKGVRADGDLGMRIYLSGALMILNPDISLLHHHAPSGGLRKHKARVVTYAASKKSLTIRHLPNPTEAYLLYRYYSDRQVGESLLLRVFGSLFVEGNLLKRSLRLAIGMAFLPLTLGQVRRRYVEGKKLLTEFPIIPRLRKDQQSSKQFIAHVSD
ncbi:glycosyltransferase family 2 protein [Sphingobacteriales bacterium CHB3]|nr:glycosyltransferase family 2 protein [Sphingobacteriales bacterium CHB3]